MLEVRTTDYHTAGEPFRIVTAGAPELPGATVRERREHARRSAEAERLRRLLCHEPRGHADMYGGILVPPDDRGARLGVLFWHKDGWSTACGHGTIALGAWAVDAGLVDAARDGGRRRRAVGARGRARALRGRRGRGGHVPQRAGLRARP
jgi:proline racemase/trans-L-3-hydroxyproline dehydratase